MPGLIAFHRRWGIGSDDLVFPCIGEITLRILWLIAISTIFGTYEEDAFHCESGHLLLAFFIGAISLLIVTLIIVFWLLFISARGTIVNIQPRRNIKNVIYLRLIFVIPEILWNILGAVWAFDDSTGCNKHVVLTVRGAVITGWIIFIIAFVAIIIIFDPLGGYHKSYQRRHSTVAKELAENVRTATKKTWELRCKVLCCCAACDEEGNDAFSDIAHLLTEFFQDVDAVPTDIAAGLILVRNLQKQEESELSAVVVSNGAPNNVLTDARPSVSNNNCERGTSEVESDSHREFPISAVPKSWMTVQLMNHFLKFAMGSYGWPLYLMMHLSTGLCKLWPKCRCCECIRRSGNVINDNCCDCNLSAIKRFTGIEEEDLIYASFHNQIYEIPFYVAVDRKQEAIVISIRGTLSLKDALTDMTAECDPLQIGGHEECFAHKGILSAAQYIKGQLEELQLLEQAFQQAPNYKLVITGHSLGAGAAALLAILLKPQYPDLMCFSFSPPGGLTCKTSCIYGQDFICSVVLGKDIIPRLGITTMEDLKMKMLRAIRSCQLPKYKILMRGCCDRGNLVTESSGMQIPLMNDSAGASYTISDIGVDNTILTAIHKTEQSRLTHSPLYPPGQILHILESNPSRSCFSTPEYYAVWSNAKQFHEILVDPSMLTDHLPNSVNKALEQLCEKNYVPRAFVPNSATETTNREKNVSGLLRMKKFTTLLELNQDDHKEF